MTAEDRNAVLTWTAVTNATAYSIYRNGFLIANTINATYTDSNLAYGTYAYYIKSRDANGAASSPTATVNIAIEPIPFNLTVTKNGNDAMLNWTEPEWSAPQNDDEVLTYGDGSYVTNFGVSNVTNMYWGHRYPTNTFSNKVLYKVSFYTTDTGSFKLFIYKGSSATSSRPSTKIAEQTITTSVTGWIDIELDTPIQIDNTKDLWVFMYDPEGRGYPAVACSYSGNDGNYFASNPTSNVNAWSGYAFNIRTYIANGSFTYNLYDNNTNIASSLSGTSYNIANISNNTAHQYTLKTYFNNGLTSASNMAGITIGTATIANLEMTANDQMTITENSKLTVSGVLSNSNAANLILENGSQLIHGSPNVQATVKKDIAAYTINTNNNWNLIASPVTENITPSADNGLLSETYDLYYYDEPTHYWRNYRNATFNLTHQQGYLYANNTNTTLQFAGSLTPSNSSVTLTDLSHSATVLNGFNLVGNPFACNATVDKSFYVTDETGSNIVLADNGRQVKPCEGIFVQATNSNTSVTFTKAGTKSRSLSSSFDITLTQGRTTIDRTRVHLDNMESLEKFSLNDNTSSQIYFTRNGKNFAVTYANGQNELPLNFKTSQNGIYNLNIEAENLDLDYLHLIDNLTGNDIDLLTTSSYTFETKTSDYASRFRLVFSNCEDAVGDNATFAYVNNGNIVINQEGTLQIVDMTGRVVYQGDTMNRVSTTGMAQGVYVLRLITAVDTKTQKIVIE